MTPVALIPDPLIVTADPTTVLVNVGVSLNVIVAPAPDAVAVKLVLTKLISPTLPAVPTTDPSSLIETPANAPTSPAVNPVMLEPSPLNAVAVSVPLEELNVRLVPLLGARFPVGEVVNNTLHVLSELSSATVTCVAVVAVVADVADVALPLNDDAVMTPVAFTVLKVGSSVRVIVAAIPDAVAVKLPLTKLIFPTLPAVPTTDPSSLIETPANAPTSPAVNPVKLEPSP